MREILEILLFIRDAWCQFSSFFCYSLAFFPDHINELSASCALLLVSFLSSEKKIPRYYEFSSAEKKSGKHIEKFRDSSVENWKWFFCCQCFEIINCVLSLFFSFYTMFISLNRNKFAMHRLSEMKHGFVFQVFGSPFSFTHRISFLLPSTNAILCLSWTFALKMIKWFFVVHLKINVMRVNNQTWCKWLWLECPFRNLYYSNLKPNTSHTKSNYTITEIIDE